MARPVGGRRSIGPDLLGGPVAVREHGLHELIRHADAVVGVLEEDRAVGVAVERRVVAGVDQRPGFALFLGFALDEIHHVGVVDIQDHHLGRAPRLAARLDHARKRVKAFHEGKGTGGHPAARQRFVGGAERGEVRTRA